MFACCLFLSDTATAGIYTLSLHAALPISPTATGRRRAARRTPPRKRGAGRSEEHTSELQSPCNLVCRLLLEKKNDEPMTTAEVRHDLSTCPISDSGRFAYLHAGTYAENDR